MRMKETSRGTSWTPEMVSLLLTILMEMRKVNKE